MIDWFAFPWRREPTASTWAWQPQFVFIILRAKTGFSVPKPEWLLQKRNGAFTDRTRPGSRRMNGAVVPTRSTHPGGSDVRAKLDQCPGAVVRAGHGGRPSAVAFLLDEHSIFVILVLSFGCLPHAHGNTSRNSTMEIGKVPYP